ncbi:hypothetical protein ABIB62_004742 [Mucilaginibacter sp. UYP25]|uniref:hypothetical protein n=1 Tax=unclassified Mucilaginibacter TaxID=2617802 RepID=UPI003397F3BB
MGAVKGTWNKWVVRERLVGLCRESHFTAFTSEATFAVTDDQLNHTISHQPLRKNQRTHGLAKAKLTLIFTLTNVLYNAQKAQTENLENSKKSVVANTIMVRGSMTR